MYDLLSAIKYMHSRNVLYRDVKPSNILWDEARRRATMIDFDVATFYSPVRLHRRHVGTDGYMAPELVRIADDVGILEEEFKKLGKNWQKKGDEFLDSLPYRGYGLPVDM